MAEIAFTTFIISCIIIAGAVAFHYRKKEDMRQAMIDEAERLMNQFLDNPSQEHFDVVYKFLAVNEVMLSEVSSELASQFISYIQQNQITQ